MRGFHFRAANRLPTICLVVLGLVAIAPITVLAQGNLRSVLEGLKEVEKFYKLFKDHKDLFDDYAVGGVTVLVPTDEAFERQQWVWEQMDEDMIKATLKYHILKNDIRTDDIISGDVISRPTLLQDRKYSNVTGGAPIVLTKQPSDEVVLVSGFSTRGTILEADVPFNNGVVQVIDAVMRVPLPLATTARDSYPDLIAFVGALYNLDIYEEFSNLQNITVFLPDTKAFQRLAGRFENEDRSAFRYILKYHIVPGQVLYAWDLVNGSTLPTYSRGPGHVPNNITITRNGNYIFPNSAQVVQTDMLISNGIVHVIDNILNPDNQTALPNLRAKTQTPVFTPTGATSVGNRVPTPFITDLPCTKDCPEPEPTDFPTETLPPFKIARPTSNPALPQFTGLSGHGLGLAALGALAVL